MSGVRDGPNPRPAAKFADMYFGWQYGANASFTVALGNKPVSTMPPAAGGGTTPTTIQPTPTTPTPTTPTPTVDRTAVTSYKGYDR